MSEQKSYEINSVRIVNRDTVEEIKLEPNEVLVPSDEPVMFISVGSVVGSVVASGTVETTPRLLSVLGIPFRVLIRRVRQFRWN